MFNKPYSSSFSRDKGFLLNSSHITEKHVFTPYNVYHPCVGIIFLINYYLGQDSKNGLVTSKYECHVTIHIKLIHEIWQFILPLFESSCFVNCGAFSCSNEYSTYLIITATDLCQLFLTGIFSEILDNQKWLRMLLILNGYIKPNSFFSFSF